MITPSFGLTATERVLPRLTLNFTTASLDSRITFARTGNTATVTNSSGLVAGINADLPRFDYDPITLVCKGLLIEQQSTNLSLYSEQYDNAYWIKLNATITANTIVAPDGALTGDKIVESANLNQHVVYNFSTTVVTGSHTFSVFAKAGERNWIKLAINSASGVKGAFFNLSTGVAGTVEAGVTQTITPVGNNWYRCTVTASTTAGLSGVASYVSTGDNIISYTGNGTSGLYIWGAQFEALAFPTSYISTVAAAVTRNADVAVMTSTNFSSWYNSTEGGAVVQVLPSTISGTRPAVQFDDNTANESIALRGVAADPQLFVVDGGATQATLDAGTITANTLYKLGGAWKDASYAVALNGAAVVTQASGTFPTATQARLGSDGTNYLNGHLQSLRFWPQRLTNAEVQAFSK